MVGEDKRVWDGVQLIRSSDGLATIWTDASPGEDLGSFCASPQPVAFISLYAGSLAKPNNMLLEALAVFHALELMSIDRFDVIAWINNQAVYEALL
jgi:hypothetical protein